MSPPPPGRRLPPCGVSLHPLFMKHTIVSLRLAAIKDSAFCHLRGEGLGRSLRGNCGGKFRQTFPFNHVTSTLQRREPRHPARSVSRGGAGLNALRRPFALKCFAGICSSFFSLDIWKKKSYYLPPPAPRPRNPEPFHPASFRRVLRDKSFCLVRRTKTRLIQTNGLEPGF